MEHLEYLSYQFLDEVMSLSDNVKAKYKEALAFITEGMRPGEAFKKSGFIEAYEKERGELWEGKPTDTV
ncbi:MAG: hypothetical protein JRJ70_08810 [Deltaproteobacteria bacterium]|nr:hypothetical protein [Deltaproteobacteria bacterium]